MRTEYEPIPIYANNLDDDILLMWLRSMEDHPDGIHALGQSREDAGRVLAGECWKRGLLRLAMQPERNGG